MNARELVGGVLRFQLRTLGVLVRAFRRLEVSHRKDAAPYPSMGYPRVVYLTSPPEPCLRCADRDAADSEEEIETELGRRFVSHLREEGEAALGRAVGMAERGERQGVTAGSPVGLKRSAVSLPSKKAAKRRPSVSHLSDKVGGS